MPIFEFKCSSCGKEFERIIFSSDEQKVDCPSCGCADTERMLSVFAGAGIEKAAACSHSHSGGHS